MKLTKKQATGLFVMLLLLVFGFVIFVVYYMVSNKEAFTENPLIYGVKKMNLGECYCDCYNDINELPISFYLNSTSFIQTFTQN